jgi:hypothetical protein
MARVLLLNPPANGRAVLRDFACGESSKADYYWAPIDLLVLSGVLAADHDLHVIDAVAESCPPSEALARARSFRPDAVFSLTAAVSLAHDEAFLAQLAADTGARIYGLGDVASFAPGSLSHAIHPLGEDDDRAHRERLSVPLHLLRVAQLAAAAAPDP